MANGSPGSNLSVVSNAPSAVRTSVLQALVRVRRNVEQANIPALTDAYQKMQARSEPDNRSWMYWSEYHGYNRNDCWHHNGVGGQQFNYDLFLPWHRAYLLYFERVAVAANKDAILPWWDWTSPLSHQVGLPPAFTAGPADGPLRSGPVPPALRANPPRTTRNPSPPPALPSKAAVDNIVDNLTTFEDFSNQLQNVHDGVHGWVGGDMGQIASSAFDPIFWSHHCMIDRLWYLWQVKHGVDNIPPSYLNRTLAPWALTVKDVLDIRRLGYSYGASRVRVPADQFSAVALAGGQQG
jgi:tyrosinase